MFLLATIYFLSFAYSFGLTYEEFIAQKEKGNAYLRKPKYRNGILQPPNYGRKSDYVEFDPENMFHMHTILDDYPLAKNISDKMTGPKSSRDGFSCTFKKGFCKEWGKAEDLELKEVLPLTIRNKKFYDMDVQGGASGSLRTGPAIDHTTLSKGGDVLYARMALISSKDALIAITPTIDSSNIPNMCLSFWYLAFGNNVGEFYVLIKDISQSMMNLGSTIWSPLFTLRTGISRSKTDWRYSQHNIKTANIEIYKKMNFLFVAVKGSGYDGDIAIDDVYLRPGKCQQIPTPRERPKSSLEIERQRAWKPIGTTQKSKVTNPPFLPFATPPSMKSTAINRLRGRKTCTKTTLLYDIFSDRKSLCCDGFLFYRNAGNACCAKSAYNTRKQICCGEEIYDKRKFICCNNMAFDKSEFHCCDITALKRKDSPERCCNEKFGKVVTFDPTKGDKCCRGKTHSKTLIAAEAGKDAVCCGDDFIKSSEKSQQCCGKKIFGIKYDKRFQACCASQTASSLYSALAESCCGGKVISKSSTKCVQDKRGQESPAPMNILDYLSKGKLPPWLACTESRMGDRVMMPASCRKPPFRWEEVYEDD